MSARHGLAYKPARLAGANPIEEATAKELHQQAKLLAHPTPAGWCDPVSITLVLDLILRLENDSTLRARHLTELLTAEYPQLSWNPNTVGRILSELAEAAMNCGATGEPPIERQLTRGGHRFAVNVNSLNWRWLYEVRQAMGELAERVVRDERALGEFSKRGAFPFDVIDQAQWGRAA